MSIIGKDEPVLDALPPGASPGEGSMARQVLRLAAPATVHYLMQTVVFFTDRLMLGLHSKEELAASGVVGPITWSVSSIFVVFTVGTLAIIARDTGSGLSKKVRQHAASAIWMAVGLSTAVGVIAYLLTDVLVGLFPVDPVVSAPAVTYLHIIFPALPILFLSFTLTAIFQASGDTFTPMVFSGIANVVNIAGNYVLIFGHWGFPELGMQGAAISSVSALGLLTLLLFARLLSRRSRLRLRPAEIFRPRWSSLRRQVAVALPAGLERVVFHSGFLAYCMVVASLGTLSLAAHQSLIAIQSLVFLPGEGFGVAAGVLCGQKLGAGRPEEAALGTRIAVAMAMTILVTAGVFFFLFPSTLIGFFTDSAEVIEIGVPALMIGAFEGIFLSVVMVLSGALRGAGDTRTPMIVTVLGTWFIRLPAVTLLGLGPDHFLGFGLDWGLAGIWTGSLVDWVFRTVVIIWAFRRGRWKNIQA